MIIVDNRNRVFHSLPSALNFGAKRANGKYIMFIHQDVSLLGDSWLERVENILDRLDQFGAAGVAGVTEKNEYKGFLYNSGVLWGGTYQKCGASSNVRRAVDDSAERCV